MEENSQKNVENKKFNFPQKNNKAFYALFMFSR